MNLERSAEVCGYLPVSWLLRSPNFVAAQCGHKRGGDPIRCEDSIDRHEGTETEVVGHLLQLDRSSGNQHDECFDRSEKTRRCSDQAPRLVKVALEYAEHIQTIIWTNPGNPARAKRAKRKGQRVDLRSCYPQRLR